MPLYRAAGPDLAEMRVTEDALDALGIGVLFVGVQGVIRRLNHLAERECGQASWLSIHDGAVRAAACEEREKLRSAIHAAAGMATGPGRARPLLAIAGTAGPSRMLVVLPLRPAGDTTWPEGGSGAALFFRASLERQAGLARTYGELRGLTRAERRLLEALMAGTRLIDYAGEAGITPNTAYAQLKSIFAKTGHSRQVDLLREIEGDLLLRLVGASP